VGLRAGLNTEARGKFFASAYFSRSYEMPLAREEFKDGV
jgi:hypothetical protein